MTGRTTSHEATNISRAHQFAHTIERVGLAMLGAICGLFVAAFIAKANVESINSEVALFAAILYASVGFYLGVNVPAAPYKLADGASKVKLSPVKLLSAIGTLLAASAALVSVCAIIFDASPIVWIASVGIAWLAGVTMQIAAGSMVRVERSINAA